jgi:hypothetical protein
MPNKIDVTYLNKNFTSFKSDLIDYAKSYYPTVYNDFSQASPGTMFIEMASYVGDVLSFYLDNQLQETFLQYAKQKNNLYTMAYMLGYRPKVTSAAIVDLDVYQQVPSITVGGQSIPDFNYALVIKQGMQVRSNVNNSNYYFVGQEVNFNVSSSLDPTSISVYQLNGGGVPQSYLLKKSTKALSGQIKTIGFSFGTAQRFSTVTINESNIVSIISAKDSNGNTWYEVPYLAQDYILNPVQNTSANFPSLSQFQNQVPYIIQKVSAPRRFVSRFRSDNTLEIEFGPGINSVADSSIIPNPNSVSVGLTAGGLSQLSSSWDPTNFVTTQTYGLAPSNITINVQYIVGGGASSNVGIGELTQPISLTVTGNNTSYQGTVVTNNVSSSVGGGDGDTVEELRLNTLAQFPSQWRAVTQQDYLARVLSMPPIYGKVAKAYVVKEDATFSNYTTNDIAARNPLLVTMYTLGLDSQGNLAQPTAALLQNIQTYIADYRMLTDAIKIKSAYVIDLGVNFDIIIRPSYNGQDVISRCLISLQDFFNIDNWQINEPIILSDVYSNLDAIDGVQTVKNVQIVNLSGTSSGYSQYSYDIQAATIDDVIYPSMDPSIFEVKFPQTDIKGRVVTH